MEHMCKVYEKLKGVEEHEKAKNELNVVIHDSLNPTMFKRNWNQFIEKYYLQDNE